MKTQWLIQKTFYALLILMTAVLTAQAGNTGQVTIVNFKTSSIGTIVYIDKDITNVIDSEALKPACLTNPNSKIIKSVFIDRSDNAVYTDFFASIMLAHANGKKVSFWLNQNVNCNDNQGGPHAIASMIYVY